MTVKRVSIIIPCFRDERIVDAIRSIRQFDDLGVARVVVVDGGSGDALIRLIRPLLSEDDILISEKDKGIFDALNKGLEASTTEYIGWLGCDDLFTGQILASDVVRALDQHDIFVTRHALYSGDRVTRVTPSQPSQLGLVKFGLNNPHFATFGRAELLKSERFQIDLLGSDIEYFVRIFDRRPSVATSKAIGVLGSEGGFSTVSGRRIIAINLQLFQVYRAHTNLVAALFTMVIKATSKIASVIHYRLFPKNIDTIIASNPSEPKPKSFNQNCREEEAS